MKIIILLCLGAFICLMGCSEPKKDVTIDGGRLRGPSLVEIRFVDEAGNNLLDRVQLHETPNNNFSIDSLQFTLQGWIDGEYIEPIPGQQWLDAHPSSGAITLRYHFSGPRNPASGQTLVIYTLKFTSPELFGNNLEHTFVIEKKEKNNGYHNNFERLLFDGKLIATDMEGDGTDNDRLPIVIVVPQK